MTEGGDVRSYGQYEGGFRKGRGGEKHVVTELLMMAICTWALVRHGSRARRRATHLRVDHLFAHAIEGLEHLRQELVLLYPGPEPHVVT